MRSTDERALRGKKVLGTNDVARSLTRVVFEIIERNGDTEEFIIAGIPTRGTFLARRLVGRISEVDGLTAEYTIIDPTVFRNDLADRPLCTPGPALIPPAGIGGRTVTLANDVLYIGRTIKATLDTLSGIGHPSRIQLAVLVDRGYRELPTRPDYVGRNLPTSRQETVTILLRGDGGRDGALLGKES